jgi:hypothetical protein
MPPAASGYLSETSTITGKLMIHTAPTDFIISEIRPRLRSFFWRSFCRLRSLPKSTASEGVGERQGISPWYVMLAPISKFSAFCGFLKIACYYFEKNKIKLTISSG